MNAINVYRIETGEVDYFEYASDETNEYLGMIPQTEIFGDIIFAESPGKAKTMFLRGERDADLEYRDIKSCRTILRDVNRAPGSIEGDDILWLQIQPDILDHLPASDFRDYPAEAQP